MKELSIEEKAQRYDKAINTIRNLVKAGLIYEDAAIQVFSELKESEDKIIREEIIDFLRLPHPQFVGKRDHEEWIAWLEKQGENEDKDIETKLSHAHFEGEIEGRDKVLSNPEKYGLQKIADKVEPKFKVGQTIKKEGFNLGFAIVKIEDGFYYNDRGDYFPFTDQDNWELVEQKLAWSEEDKMQLDAAIHIVANSGHTCTSDWLKALKERVELQNSYNPYKEVVESIAEMCKHYDTASHSGLRDFYDNVRVKCKDAKEYDSLYPQNTWKLNEEQIKKELNKAANEWERKASFSPIAMVMDGNRPIGTKQHITSHADSFKAGVDWLIKKLREE